MLRTFFWMIVGPALACLVVLGNPAAAQVSGAAAPDAASQDTAPAAPADIDTVFRELRRLLEDLAALLAQEPAYPGKAGSEAQLASWQQTYAAWLDRVAAVQADLAELEGQLAQYERRQDERKFDKLVLQLRELDSDLDAIAAPEEMENRVSRYNPARSTLADVQFTLRDLSRR